MHPVIHILGYAFQSYYVCAAAAALTGFGLLLLTTRSMDLGKWRFLLPLMSILLALAGARLLNALLDPIGYDASFPVYTLSYRKLSLMGGLVLGTVPFLLYVLLQPDRPLALLDALVLPGAAAIVLLKLGCFLNGCCCGKETTGFWGVEFPSNRMVYAMQEALNLIPKGPHPVYPTQLFEMAGALAALLAALLAGRWKRLRPGGQFGLFAALFCAVRWALLPLRAFPYSDQVLKIGYPIFYAVCMGLSLLLFFMSLPCGKRMKPPGHWCFHRRKKIESSKS